MFLIKSCKCSNFGKLLQNDYPVFTVRSLCHLGEITAASGSPYGWSKETGCPTPSQSAGSHNICKSLRGIHDNLLGELDSRLHVFHLICFAWYHTSGSQYYLSWILVWRKHHFWFKSCLDLYSYNVTNSVRWTKNSFHSSLHFIFIRIKLSSW